MKNNNLTFLIFLLFFSKTLVCSAQFTITPANNQTAWEAAIQSLQGQGVTIQNINVDCGNNAFATFTKVNPQELIDLGAPNLVDIKANSGFVLSTGDATDIGNNAGFFASSSVSGAAPTDNDLANYIDTQQDVCVVTFEVIPLGEDLNFNYVFASEEYPEYVCSPFNDAFGFFISGPGINGPFSNGGENIALVPDITDLTQNTNEPVSIGSINWGYFANNNASVTYCGGTCGDGTGCPCNCPFYIPNNTGSLYEDYMVFDGQTTLLSARQTVIPCETYTVKMVIADRGDTIFDSAVFVEAGSLTAKSIDIVTEGGINAENFYTDTFGSNVAVEDCVNQQVLLGYNFEVNAGDVANVYLTVSGSADAADVFSNPIPTIIPIAPGDTSTVINIIPEEDGLTEGLETIIVQIDSIKINSCNFPINVIDTIYIIDKINGQLTEWNNTSIELGDTIKNCAGFPKPIGQATPVGSFSYNWYGEFPDMFQFTTGTAANDSVVFIAADTSMMIYCDIEIAPGCFATDSVFIDLAVPPKENNFAVCPGQTINLEVIGLNTDQSVSSWGTENTNLLSNLVTNTATFTAPITGGTFTYNVAINDANCGQDYEQVITVEVGNKFLDDSLPELFKCPTEDLDITVLGGNAGTYSYTFNGTNLATGANENFIFSETDLGTLQVIAEGAANCRDTIEIEIKEIEDFANAGEDAANCYQAIEQIGVPATNGFSYEWFPATGLNSDTVAQPIVSIDTLAGGLENTITYTVMVTDASGCTFSDEVIVTATNGPNVSTSVTGINPVQVGATSSLTASGLGVETYEWSSITGSGLQNETGETVNVRPTSLADSLYIVTAYDANGCFKTDTIKLEIIAPPSLYMPTAFSPNGDNINDVLLPIVSDVTEIITYEVYNRWGKKVYSGSQLGAGWDGKDFNLEDQPLGVYVWYIEYQEIGKTGISLARGSVTLIR